MILFILVTKKFRSERKIIEGEDEGKNSPSESPQLTISSEQVQQGNYLFDYKARITAKVLFLFAKINLRNSENDIGLHCISTDVSSSLIIFGFLF